MKALVLALRAVIVTAAIALAAARFLAIDATSHSNSDTLRPWLIQVALIGLVGLVLWLAVGRLARPRVRP